MTRTLLIAIIMPFRDFENNRLVLCFRPQSSQRRTSYRVLSITPHPNVNHVYIQYTKASSVTTEDRVLEVFVEDLFKVGKAVYKYEYCDCL